MEERIVSPLLFGSNLEHTRADVIGGISAEMLKNRKFVGKPGSVERGCAAGWHPIGEKTYLAFGEPYTRHGEGYRMKRRLETNAQEITNRDPGEKAGIAQEGLYVNGGKTYLFTTAVRSFGPGALTVLLKDGSGRVLAEDTFPFAETVSGDTIVNGHFSYAEYAPADDFREYTLELSPDESCDNARLEIFFSEEGCVSLGAVSLMPKDNFHGMRRDVIALMKEMGISILRWPGGNFAGEYHWKDGLLPRNMRAPFESYMGLETQPNSMGYDMHEINTDDFLALCAEIGAEPFITVNPAWNTAEESAEWVQYVGGRARYWSLGNEFGYGHMEGDNTAAGYAAVVRKHAEAMKAVDPEIILCSSGPYPDPEWAEHAAKPLADLTPFVSLHNYLPFPRYRERKAEKAEYERCIDNIYTVNREKARAMRALLNANGLDGLRISFDEWNTWYAWYRPESVTDGIFAAVQLHMMIGCTEEFGIGIGCHFETVNEGAILVRPDRAWLTPMGQMIAMMKKHAGGVLKIAEKDVAATVKEGVLTITLVNPSYDEEEKYRLPFGGEILERVLYTSEEVTPPSSFTVTDELKLAAVNGEIRIVLPSHSAALIRIR